MRDLSREHEASLGSLLREARDAKGITQVQLSEAVNAGGGPIVSHWEKGTRHPTLAQIHQIQQELDLSEAGFEDLYYAWMRETSQVPMHWLLSDARPEQLLEDLDRIIALVRGLRAAGQPRIAVVLAGRDAAAALRRLREFPWSSTHAEVIRKVAELVLQEVKAALDYLPRIAVSQGELNSQLALLQGAGAICDDTATRFLGALALEGATYVSGDVKKSYRQTRQLLDRSERIPQIHMPEVLRAAAINAGKSKKFDALIDVQARIDSLLERNSQQLSRNELGYLLEGVARAWGTFDPGRASALSQEAWTCAGFEQGLPATSALRFVQLTRTQAEIELSRPSGSARSSTNEQVAAALVVSRRENFDRYIDQLEALLRTLEQ